MNPETIALLVLEGLKTFNMIYADIPVAERRKNWEAWCKFWQPLQDAILAGSATKA